MGAGQTDFTDWMGRYLLSGHWPQWREFVTVVEVGNGRAPNF